MLTLRIRKHAFQIPSRFEPGHRLSAGEAQAMNALLVENVRNNVDQWVVEELEGRPSGLLPATVHQGLQARILAYASAYEFRERLVPGGRKGPLEIEIARLAAQRAAELANFHQVDEAHPVIVQAREAWMVDPEVHEQARVRLETQRQVAAQALDELLP